MSDLTSILNRTTPYLIAEIGVNHEGNLDLAKRQIDLAKEGGADAVKFQTYKAETLASRNSPAYWDRSQESCASQYELFKRYDRLQIADYFALAQYCSSLKIDFLTTAFDVESATEMASLMWAIKISSSDITNRPLIELQASWGKPILLSTGASNFEEIRQALSWIEPYHVPVCLLHCVLLYPTPEQDACLGRIEALQEAFPGTVIGYSDHVVPGDMHILDDAWRLGAAILEKHFTHDKSLPGNDHYHAMDVDDLKALKKRYVNSVSHEEIRQRVSYGGKTLDFRAGEEKARKHARRSLVLNKNLVSGSVLTAQDLTWKRPAHGIPPYRLHELVGMRINQDLEQDTILQESFFY